MNGEERASRAASRGEELRVAREVRRGNSSAFGVGATSAGEKKTGSRERSEEAELLERTMRRTTTTTIAKQLDLFSGQRRQRKKEHLPPPVVTVRKNSRVPH